LLLYYCNRLIHTHTQELGAVTGCVQNFHCPTVTFSYGNARNFSIRVFVGKKTLNIIKFIKSGVYEMGGARSTHGGDKKCI